MSMKTPKYEEVTVALRELAETLAPGDRFLTHREVMRRFQVSDRTALRSLEELQRSGRIVRRSGVGTFIADGVSVLSPRATRSVERPVAPSATLLVYALSDSPFFHNAVDQITAQAAAAGLTMVCHYVRGESPTVDLTALTTLRPTGALIFGYPLEPLAIEAQAAGTRAVLIGVPPAGVTPGVPCLYSDHEESGYQVARHLLERGHRRIAIAYEYCGRSDVRTTYRWRGFARALEEAGLPAEEALRHTPPAETVLWQRTPERAAAFFARPNSPTAIAAWNDWEARTLLRALRSAGLRVPADVSLIGHDNDPTGADLEPPLDTVDQHIDVQVRCALRLLTSDQSIPTTTTVVVPTLITRASCAPPPADRDSISYKGVM